MKVFALAILLVSVCCLEGAVVKRQAEGQAQVPGYEEVFQRFSETVHQYIPHDLISQEKLTELRTQAQAGFQRIQDHVKPIADQLQERAVKFFSSLTDSFKTAAAP